MSGGNGIGGLGGGSGSPASVGEGTGPSDEYTPYENRRRNVSYTEEDLGILSAFESTTPPQHLIDMGLVTPFEYIPPDLVTGGVGDIRYQSPSEFAAQYEGMAYTDPRLTGSSRGRVLAQPVHDWIAEMEAARENQYFQWQTDFGHFLGGAGTRLASRFDTEEAKVRKQTLLPGEGIV